MRRHSPRLASGSAEPTDVSRRQAGRPTKFDARLAERIVWFISQGVDRYEAAERAGIGRATLYRWLADPRPPFKEFQAQVTIADAQAEAAITWNLVRQSRSNTRAALAWLQAHDPQHWGAPTPMRRPRSS